MSIEVVATANGYYGGKIREPGETFVLNDEAAFSDIWMERAGKGDGVELRRVNTGGTDGITGGQVPKAGAKLPAKERIALAKQLSGRDDIDTAKEADAILAAANTGSDNDDRSRDFASDPANDAPDPAPGDDGSDND